MAETTIRLEFSEGGSHKFWEIARRGSEVVTTWGRIGTAGQVQTKAFASEIEAESFISKQASAKRKKGYAEAAQSAGLAAAHAPAAPAAATQAAESKPARKSAAKAPAVAKPAKASKASEDVAEGAVVLWNERQRSTRLRFIKDYVSSDAEQKLFGIDKHPWNLPLRPTPATAEAALEILRPRLRHFLLAFKERIAPTLSEPLAELRRLALPDRGLEPLGLEAAAVGLTLMPAYDQSLSDWLILSQGAAFTTEALLASLAYHRPVSWEKTLLDRLPAGRAYEIFWPEFGFLTLHRWLREAGPAHADYAAARDRAAALRAQGTGSERALMSWLLSHERDWIEADARDWLALDITGIERIAHNRLVTAGKMGHWYLGWQLWPLLVDHELQAAYEARLAGEADYNRHQMLNWLATWAPWALYYLGPDAAGLLATLAVGAEHAEDRKTGAELLALIHHPAAFARMAPLLTGKEGQKYFLPRFIASPELGIPALLASVAEKPRQAELRRLLEAQLQLAEPALLDQLVLPEAEAALLTQWREQQAPQAATASAESLPEFLRTPPWQRQAGASKLPNLALEMPLADERIKWLPEDQGLKPYVYRQPPQSPERDDEWLAWMRNRIELDELDRLSPAAALETLNALFQGSPRLSYAPKPMKLAGWRLSSYDVGNHLAGTLRRFGLAGLPGLLAIASKEPKTVYPYLARIISPRLAYAMARGLELAGLRSLCLAWMQRYKRETALGLIALALAPDEPQAGWCGEQLRRLATWPGFAAAIAAAAAEYGPEAEAATTVLLALDPLQVPCPKPSLPGFLEPRLLSALVLAEPGEALSPDAVAVAAGLLALSDMSLPHAGVAELKRLCTPASLDAFAWSLARLWLDQGAPKAQQWMLGAIALIGGEASLAQLQPLVEKWPGENAHPRAILGLDVLVAQGSVKALAGVLKISRKSRFQALKEAAGARLREVAAARGLSLDALLDRLVPDHGFDAGGQRSFPIAGQAHAVLIDGALKAQLLGADGQVMAKLPKGTPKEDEKAWKAFKKELEATLSLQAQRLETAMCDLQRWSREDFEAQILAHPLMGLLARRLLWALWQPGGDEPQVFALSATARGEAWLDVDGNALNPVPDACLSPAHPLHFYPEREDWRERLGDSPQPFEQLARAVWFPSPEDYARIDPSRFKSRKVPSGALLALKQRGWKNEGESEFCKRYGQYRVSISTGFYSWAMGMSHIGDVDIDDLEITELKRHRKAPPAALDPISFSELLRDVEYLERGIGSRPPVRSPG